MIAGFASKALNALPAVRPVTSETTPSRLFQTIVKYSSLEPRRAIAARSRDSVPSIFIGYSAKGVEAGGQCCMEVRKFRCNLVVTCHSQTESIRFVFPRLLLHPLTDWPFVFIGQKHCLSLP